MEPQTTLQAALDYFLSSKVGVLSPATVKWYRKRLGSLLDFLGAGRVLTAITVNELRAWRGMLAERTTRFAHHPSRPELPGGLSRFTLQSYVRSARAFFRWCEEESLLAASPARRLELPQLPDTPRKGISDEDARRILEQAQDDPRDYAVCCLLADTGARVAGVAGLRLDELDLERRRAIVHEKGRGGGGKARAIFMQETTVRALRRYLAVRPDVPGCGTVFLSRKRNAGPAALGRNGIYLMLKRRAAAAGVEDRFSPHQWRHAFARHMLSNGANLAQVQQLMGHSDPGVTAKFYGTFAVPELQEAHDRYVLRLDTRLSPSGGGTRSE